MRTEESKAATKRYCEAMRDVIRRNQDNGGKIRNKTKFAESMGYSIQNIDKLTKDLQDTTTTLLIRSARVYGINPNWVLLNVGIAFISELIAPIKIPVMKTKKKKRRMVAR